MIVTREDNHTGIVCLLVSPTYSLFPVISGLITEYSVGLINTSETQTMYISIFLLASSFFYLYKSYSLPPTTVFYSEGDLSQKLKGFQQDGEVGQKLPTVILCYRNVPDKETEKMYDGRTTCYTLKMETLPVAFELEKEF